jgi:hypothetical protein
MRIPPLQSAAYPFGPQWTTPQFTLLELNRLCMHLAVFIGIDKARGCFVPLGNGFIVKVGDHLQIMTAAHIFSDFSNRLWDRPRHAFAGADPLGDLQESQQRIGRMIKGGLVKVLLHTGGALEGPTELLDIIFVSCGNNIEEHDVALVQCTLPTAASLERPPVLLIDTEHFNFTVPVVLAGLSPPKEYWEVPFESAETLRRVRWHAYVRAGYVGEIDPLGGPHLMRRYRVNIPTMPGMSGGPMIRIRPPLGVDVGGPVGGLLPVWTAVGVISKGKLGEHGPGHCPDGETLVYAISDVGLLSVKLKEGMLDLVEQTQRGYIESYQTVLADILAGKHSQTVPNKGPDSV